MPPLTDCCAPWQWRDPSWVHSLVDAAYRVPLRMPVQTLRASADLVSIVIRTFPCFDTYRAKWFIEHLYRHMGRHCLEVAAEMPRDTTNYMSLAPTMTLDEDHTVCEQVCMGQSCGCVRLALRDAYTTQTRCTVRFSLLSPSMDEQGMAEYEERARRCLVQVARSLSLEVTQLRYTPRWGAHGVPTYTVLLGVTPIAAD